MAVKGSFKDITFIELLQMMHLARKTGRLEVTHEAKWAMVIFNEGVVWHVEPRGFRGATSEEVLYMLIAMNEANFVFQRVHVLPALDRTIHIGTDSIILEGTKRLDDQAAVAEQTGDGKSAGLTNKVLQFKPGAEAKVRYVPQNVRRIVQLIDGKRNIEEVVTSSQLDAAQAAQIIKELMTQDVVEAIEVAKEEEPAA